MALKSTITTFIIILLYNLTSAQNVGIGTNSPHSSAKLHIEDTNRGLLIPRVSLVDVTNGNSPVNTPIRSLLVFNTNVSVTGGSGEGFYYWDGTMWVALSGGPADAWLITGNTGTSAATNFIGTTDAVDWVVRTNNTEVMRATSGQKVGVGLTNPTYKLDVTNAVLAIRGTTSGMFTTSVYGHSTNATAGNGVAGQSDGSSPLMAGLYGTAQNGAMALITNGPSNMNVNGGNFDTWIEGDTDPYLFYVDATTDHVGISTNFPSDYLDIEVSSTQTGQNTKGLDFNQTSTGDVGINWQINGTTVSSWYIDNSLPNDPFVIYQPAYGAIYRLDKSGNLGLGVDASGQGIYESSTRLTARSIGNTASSYIFKAQSTSGGDRFAIRSDGGTILYNRANTIASSISNGVILYAEDVSSSSELKVRDESGFVTTLSPHNFTIIPEGSTNSLGWAFYSEQDKVGKAINVDMYKMASLVEQLSGENLIYTADLKNKNEDGTFSDIDDIKKIDNSLNEVVKKQQNQIDKMQKQIDELTRLLIDK